MEEQNYMFKYKTLVYIKVKNFTIFNSSFSFPNTQNSNIISQVIINSHLYIFFTLGYFFDSNIESFNFTSKTSIPAFNIATSSHKSASFTKSVRHLF